MDTISGFKGFDKDLKCRGFQFKTGEVFKEDAAVICKKGFHFCENPLDVFSHYPPADSRFAEVVGTGKTAKHDGDSKVACTELHVKAEITLSALIGAGVKFILDKVDWKDKKESNTGYGSAATNTGDGSAATNTGYGSAATVEGKDSIACGLGYANKTRGALGCWLVLADRRDDGSIRSVRTAKVDGKTIKEMVFYEVRSSKICKAK